MPFLTGKVFYCNEESTKRRTNPKTEMGQKLGSKNSFFTSRPGRFVAVTPRCLVLEFSSAFVVMMIVINRFIGKEHENVWCFLGIPSF